MRGEPKTIKEIAAEIRRSTYFVKAAKSAMEKQGIKWTLNMMSIESFLVWVRVNNFRSTGYGRRATQSNCGDS